MKKLLHIFSSALFILPAVINTVVVLWIFVYPWLDDPACIHIPWQMLLVLGLFWLSGILLARGNWYGSIPAIAVPVYVLMENASGYSGISHINWLPIAALTAGYYLVCSLLALKKQK